MAYFLQDPTSIDDTDTISLSLWFSFAEFPALTDLDYGRCGLVEWFIPAGSVANWIYAKNMADSSTSSLNFALAGQNPGPHSNAVSGGVPFVYTLNRWTHLFFSCQLNSALVNLYINNADLLTPNLPDSLSAFDPLADYTIGINGGSIGHPIITVEAFDGHPKTRFAYLQMWWGTYIDPSPDNLSKFFTVVQGGIVPPTNLFAAQTAFGISDIYFVRDKVRGYNYQTNQGTAGPFSVVGTPPIDYTPGPGQAGTPGLLLSHERNALVSKGAKLSLHHHL